MSSGPSLKSSHKLLFLRASAEGRQTDDLGGAGPEDQRRIRETEGMRSELWK